MSDTVLAALIGGIAGLISGAVGSLVAPWANWGVEQRRNRQAQQRQIIAEARLNFSGAPRRREDIRRNKAYMAIQAHLSRELTDRISQTRTMGSEEAIQDQLMGELSDLEKKWGLV